MKIKSRVLYSLTFILAVALVGVIIAVALCSAKESAYAAEGDYEISGFEPEDARYHNDKDGCGFYVYVNASVHDKITKIVYDSVKLASLADTVTVDDENNVTLKPGQSFLEKGVTVNGDDLKPKENTMKYYFTVSTKANCAFIFTVYYKESESAEEIPVYGSAYGKDGGNRTNLYYYRKIDDSSPTAYCEYAYFDSGKYVFNVTIKGNSSADSASADSGIKSFCVCKAKNNVSSVIEEIKNVGVTETNYKLAVTLEKAVYYVDIIDNAGNATRKELFSYSGASYDEGFESAVKNKLNELKSDDVYSSDLISRLEKAYNEYFFAIQDTSVSDSEIKKLQDVCYGILKEIHNIQEGKKEGLKDVTVKNFNTEYLGGEITLTSSSALPTKYGDNAVFTVTVAEYDLKKVDKTAAVKFGNIKNALYVISVTTELTVKSETITEKCDGTVCLSVPWKDEGGKKLKCVQTAAGEETVYSDCEVIYGRDRAEIYISYPTGVLDIFVVSEKDLTWLWSLTALPVVALAIAVPIIIKKKKSNKK